MSQESKELESRRKFLERVDEIYDSIKRVPWAVFVGLAFAGILWIVGLFPQNEIQGSAARDRNQFIPMTRVDARSEKGSIDVPLHILLEKKMVSFDYDSDGNRIPLLAYRSPAGKIVTVIGLSKPCNSRDFHIEGAEIVCDICHTRWNLESLEGVEGECKGQSLAEVPHFLHKGRLIIRETDLQNKRLQLAGKQQGKLV